MLSLISFLALVPVYFFIFTRRPAVALAGFFLLFPLMVRSIDVLYLDLFGPLFASELSRYVGGNNAAPMFHASVLCFALPLLWLFRDSAPAIRACRVHPAWTGYHMQISRIAFIGSAGIIAALYLNMLRVGVIPLLESMDRLDYDQIAGIFHRGAYELNFLMCFALGCFTVLPRLNAKDYDLRFGLLMMVLLFYWILTGNRFSIFFSQFSFYFMPFAAVAIGRRWGIIPPPGKDAVIQRLLASRAFRAVAAFAVAFTLIGLVLNSYYTVRNYRDPLEQIQERMLIQPVEMWSAAWDRIDFDEPKAMLDKRAFDGIFINPIDATRNTTIQYLMSMELGYFRAAELTTAGQQYNGGYPEVHFELFNPWLALLTMPLFGLLTGWMLRLTILLAYRNMIASALASLYVFFGLSLHYAGGSLSFVLTPTYWAKIAALVIAYFWEVQFSAKARQDLHLGSGGLANRRPVRLRR